MDTFRASEQIATELFLTESDRIVVERIIRQHLECDEPIKQIHTGSGQTPAV